MNTAMVERLCAQLNEVTISCDMDLVGAIWQDRPELPASKTFELALRYTGKSAAQKLSEVREAMAEGRRGHPISSPGSMTSPGCSICGPMISHVFPVALCYILIDQQDAVLYINDRAAERTI